MSPLPPSDERVTFTLSISPPERKSGFFGKAASLVGVKSVIVLSLLAIPSSGPQTVLFETTVKVQQIQGALKRPKLDAEGRVKKNALVPLSLRVNSLEKLASEDIVYVEVQHLAEQTGLLARLESIRGLPTEEDLSANASRVSAFVQDRLKLNFEKIYIANSLREKLNAEIPLEVLEAARKCVAENKRLNPDQLAAIALDKTFMILRTQGSHSIHTSARAGDEEPLEAWRRASEIVRELAVGHQPLTLNQLSDIHRILYKAPPDEPTKVPGKLRTQTVLVGGMFGACYLHHDFIEGEMISLLDWIEASLPECQSGRLNPLVVSALAYQRMVSIHPFCDANGRATRLVMDYILQRCQLPPAALGDSIEVAIFGTQEMATSHLSKTPAEAVLCVLRGVEKSYQLLQEGDLL